MERTRITIQGVDDITQEDTYTDVVAQVDFAFSMHTDDKKRRRQNISRAIKALKPTKRSILSPRRWWFGGKWAHRLPTQCCIDGVDCSNADYGDLRNHYMRDVNGKMKKFQPWSGVLEGKGVPVPGTYCPQHLMLYHKLSEWLIEEDAEADPRLLTKMMKRGITYIPVVKKRKQPEPALVQKWEPVMLEARNDGIPVLELRDSTDCPNCGHTVTLRAKLVALQEGKLKAGALSTGQAAGQMMKGTNEMETQ